MNTPILSLKVVRDAGATYSSWTATDPESVAKLFEKVFGLSELAEENLCMASLDTRHHPCGFWKVATGSLNESIVHPREVFKRALMTNAHAVVLAHNHPSGNPGFSPQDRKCTERLKKAGDILGVELLDFLSVAYGGRFESAARKGLLGR